ncbi:Carboxypeptidase C (cathepsin A) [Faunimonas pinastri]|uniref:Carboxypeptidase C (Cathepsin A) n=1 Tax=Faunimonas pinastri TaxID=1855383 RepID=A0A1H9APP9_9HYPH|nr:peptidase S10 [Faunimonas pinastri]SEP78734.1 Carboxypeptidase C (cathepsin A) [Faunimonas pinastri]
MVLRKFGLSLAAALALSVAAITPACVLAAEQGEQQGRQGGRQGGHQQEGPGILSLLPEASTTQHSIALPTGSLSYTAKAGTLPLRDGSGETKAQIFYIAYTADADAKPVAAATGGGANGPAPAQPAARAATRPITFVFNGGPGAASAYLNLGAIGPRRLVFAANGEIAPPPSKLEDNPDTWLVMTDLVFIDPVGTGYSRGADPEDEKNFWGVKQDADAMAAFIRLYLAQSGRMTSPVFLAGESYGGFRAALLADRLQGDSGIAPSGVVMISPALEFSFLDSDPLRPLSTAMYLPAMAATNLEKQGVHGREALAARMGDIERFALGDYLVGLVAGYRMSDDMDRRVADLIGLPLDVVQRQFGRVSPSVFVKEFDRKDGRVLSRYDGTVSGPDDDPADPHPRAPDAILDRSVPAWTSAFVGYVRDELGYRTDISFRLLNREIAGKWDYGTSEHDQGYAGVMDNLQRARALNPAMRVMIAQGYTDLVTPYLTTRYLIDHVPPVAGAAPVELKLYEGGHMLYTRPDSRRALSEDAAALYRDALGAPAAP